MKLDVFFSTAGLAPQEVAGRPVFVVDVLRPSAVDWIRLSTGFTSSLMLAIVWRYIRKVNRDSGKLIRAEINGLVATKNV